MILLKLFIAIAIVESNLNPNAFNPKENAAGIVQIRPILVKDVNRISGKKYTLEDRFSVRKSYEMFCIYLTYYKPKTYEQAARMWNGGPKGHLKKSTLKYWKKVKKYLDNRKTIWYIIRRK